MKKIAIILTTFLSTSLFAAQTAKVLMVRGKVTALKPGSKKAVLVKRGDVYPEDTSILTTKKSIVRLKFADKSTMNLGPKSKVVVSKMPEKKPNMINLLTGAIKAEVNKKSKKTSKNKMLIKTRSAVMGVRGTKFQAGFNATNGNTSLVTVEGKVAMVKKKAVEKKIVKEVVQEKVVDESGKEVMKDVVREKVVQQATLSPEDELDALDKALETSKETVEVPAGRFSGVSEQASNSVASAPTKIAPKQYDALAKSMNSTKKAKDVFSDEDLNKSAKNTADAAGTVGQKAGGYVDFGTGIYVPPPKGSKKDNKTGVYVAEDIGGVDAETGDYIPPKGVKLDAKKGFVVDQKEVAKFASADKEQFRKSMARLESVNTEVKKQVDVATMEAVAKEEEASWWKPDYQHLSASIRPYSETISTTNKNSSSEADFYTKTANLTEITWAQQWNDRWTTRLGLGMTTYEIDDSDVSVRDVSEDDARVSLGLFYDYSVSLRFGVELIEQAFFFPYPAGQGELELGSENLSYLNLSGRYFLFDWKYLGVFTGVNLMLFGEDELPADDGADEPMVMESFGFNGYITGRYEFRDDMGINVTGFLENINHETDQMQWNRLSLGTIAQFYYTL